MARDDLSKTPEFKATMSRLKDAMHGNGEDVYWLARDIAPILGYTWEGFAGAIERAREALVGNRSNPDNHIRLTSKMVKIGSGAEREVPDYFLSRTGCNLIAMNGEPSKAEIAAAQAYFVVQARRMEILDEIQPHKERIALRDQVTEANKDLQEAAAEAGVRKFGVFQNAGYEGLYGMPLQAVKAKKSLGERESLMDRAGRAELAANAFRITQTEQKIRREKIHGEQQAINTHKEVGAHVRRTIDDIGGTMPEDLPTEPPIKEIKKKVKSVERDLLSKKRND